MAMRDTTTYGGNTIRVMNGTQQQVVFEQGLKRYVDEATILSRFSGLPGVVSVRDFFYENGTAYIVMEYIDGISLKEYLQNRGGKLNANETLNIMESIIRSLAIIHQNNLLHRDISPDNIMISNNGEVKLIDFGAARYFSDDSEKSMTVVLKHGYAPIEQYSRRGEHGEWTDLYALCAVMYRMLTGIVPDEATDRIKVDGLIKVRKLNRKVPKHIAAAIEKGLSVQPEDRYQNMMELYNELYQSKKQLRATKAARRTKAFIRFIIAAIIAIVIGSGVALVNYFRNSSNSNDYGYNIEYQYEEDINL
jgi:serine/threonine protein kinase